MWHPKRIEFQNLFAHVNSAYEFKNGICTVIFGENKDAEDCDNNGAGKSTLFEAIAIALTNKSLRDLDKELFINRSAEECYVGFELYNEVSKKSLKIERRFFRGSKSAKIAIWENGVQNKQITSVNEANKYVFEVIGITRDDLLRYFIISQDNSYTFFKAGDVEKKEVLNRITSADMINPILQKLSEDKKNVNVEAMEVESDLVSAQEKIEFIKEQIIQVKTLSDDYEISKREESISEAEDEIKQSKERIKNYQKKLSQLKKDKEAIEGAGVDVSEKREKRKKIRKKIDSLSDEVSEAKKIVRQLNQEIDGVVECPNCKHKFILDSDLDLTYDEAVKTREETKALIEELNSIIAKKQLKITKLDEVISKAEEAQEQVSDIESEESAYNRKIKREQDEISDANEKIVKLNKDIEHIKKESRSIKILKELKTKLKEQEDEVKELEKKQTEIQDKSDMIDYWIYYMGKNGFSTYLANRAVSIIEGITNSYLRKFHSNLSVEINGYKILKDGSVREKIDVRVLDNGMDSTVFMGCSGGERGRVSLAGVLGIQHLINMSSDGKGLDMLLLDETFHGVDAKGQENMIRILENVGVTVLMITQNVSSEFQSNNRLMVVKENKVARFMN